jgi:hypothetical protein
VKSLQVIRTILAIIIKKSIMAFLLYGDKDDKMELEKTLHQTYDTYIPFVTVNNIIISKHNELLK